MEFVGGARGNILNEALPDSGSILTQTQGVGLLVPGVEFPDDRNRLGIRGPERKLEPGIVVDAVRMGAQFFIELGVDALAEKIDILVGK
jgi:hypothetical protein